MSEEIKTPLVELCQALDHALEMDPRGGAVPGLLEAYARDHSDWESFENFVEGRYTRSLVRRTENYELLVLSWGAGEESPVHNHMGQRCWMAVLDGEMEEVHFSREDGGSGPLIEGLTKRFVEGSWATHFFTNSRLSVAGAILPSRNSSATITPFSAMCPTMGIYPLKPL